MNTSATPQPAPVKRWGLHIFYSIFLLLLFSATIYLIVRQIGLNGGKNRLQKEVQAIEQLRSETESVKNRRLHFFQNRFMLELPFRQSFAAADFVRRLSLIIPEELATHKLILEPGLQSIVFELELSVPSLRGPAAQRLINVFLVKLRQFPDLLEVSRARPVDLESSDEGRAAASYWTEVNYSITGIVDVE